MPEAQGSEQQVSVSISEQPQRFSGVWAGKHVTCGRSRKHLTSDLFRETNQRLHEMDVVNDERQRDLKQGRVEASLCAGTHSAMIVCRRAGFCPRASRGGRWSHGEVTHAPKFASFPNIDAAALHHQTQTSLPVSERR